MFDFLFKKRPTINSINLDKLGWNIEEVKKEQKVWINPERTAAMSINFFDMIPDIPQLRSNKQFQEFYRKQIIDVNGGLICCEIVKINDIDAVKLILKIPMQPHGMSYLGSYTFPFQKHSYVIKIHAEELGHTGMRDTMISIKWRKENQEQTKDDPFNGWFKDPYDSSIKEGVLMNYSEQEQFDEKFPNHPLSIVRSTLAEIKNSIEFEPKILNLPKFFI